ncbi:MAG: hypothetical protein O7I42_04820 [Alphaproteobacteria bacterium]|nr:hypothetical protein [Alphaproteobacteria bacterium]
MSAAIEKLAPGAAARTPAAPAFSDDALALDFTRRYGDRLRYVATWGKWLEYDGTRWTPDATVQVFDLARAVCREKATTCNKEGEAKKLASAATVAAVERLARSDRQHAATAGQWDADPWALNTPDGTVNLVRQIRGSLGVENQRLGVEQPEQLRQCSRGRLQLVVGVGQVDDRLEEPVEVHQ